MLERASVAEPSQCLGSVYEVSTKCPGSASVAEPLHVEVREDGMAKLEEGDVAALPLVEEVEETPRLRGKEAEIASRWRRDAVEISSRSGSAGASEAV